MQLQVIIESVVPNAELFYKWRIPFYYVNEIPLCYLNQSKDYVDFAFWHGEKIEKYKEYFVTTNRKSIASLRFRIIDDIHDEVIIHVLEQQLLINENPFKSVLGSKTKN